MERERNKADDDRRIAQAMADSRLVAAAYASALTALTQRTLRLNENHSKNAFANANHSQTLERGNRVERTRSEADANRWLADNVTDTLSGVGRYRLKITIYGNSTVTSWKHDLAKLLEDAAELRKGGFDVVVQNRSGRLALDTVY